MDPYDRFEKAMEYLRFAIEKLKTERQELVEVLMRLEDVVCDDNGCGICHGRPDRGHVEGCPMIAVVRLINQLAG